jgi:glycosyltransferase involved in cell wall biosynthesis
MKIAQVSPLYESVPPKTYGGTERVVSYLSESLVAMGHDVTLFASGDSETSATLVPCCPRSLRLDPDSVDRNAHHILMIERVLSRRSEFDLIHWHIDYLHFPSSRRSGAAGLTTLHGRLDLPELQGLYREFHDMPVVSISDAQRAPLSAANWVATIHHGLPAEAYRAGPGDGDYFVFLGRISPEKRVDRAIAIAQAVGIPLYVAAKVDVADAPYFQREVEPLLAHPLVRFVGEVGEAQKAALLGRARALLFPIDWPEPFGLVMIESMACGTPVIAYRRGSVPEVMDDGVTGFVVDNDTEAALAAARVHELDRAAVRRVFEARFTARVMAENYLALYQRLLEGRVERASASGERPAHKLEEAAA